MSLNLANALTLLRLAGALPFAYYLWLAWPEQAYSPLIATAGFVLLAATDWLDGLCARRSGQVSRFGQLSDPVADKVLGVAVVALLALQGGWSVWIPTLLFLKEVALGLGVLLFFEGRTMPAAWPGKIGTVLLFVAIPMGLLGWPVGEALAWIGTGLSLFAGAYYARRLAQDKR